MSAPEARPAAPLDRIDLREGNDPLALPRRVALVRPDLRPAVRRLEERYVMSFPHLIVREVILLQVVIAALALAALLFDAPLEDIANPLETPNPAKAPWYFLGLQELLHYFPPVVAGVLLPTLVVVALVVIPYARVNLEARALWAGAGRRRRLAVGAAGALLVVLFAAFACWPIVVPTVAIFAAMFAADGGERGGRMRRALARVTLPEWIMTWFVVIAVLLTVIGTFFRGPSWTFAWPWAGGSS
jgi:quinol-cytochrome oxidoreductase complex cytochrome b subunit